jgi:hypothetical protein
MDILFAFLEILKYILPSVVVFLTSYYLIKQLMQSQERRTLLELRKKSSESINPLRLQAYERAVLFLERITPNSLVMRVFNNRMSVRDLHTELLSSIRNEYDHNITQQIYMSSGSWEALKRAKEETIKLVNIAASKVDDSAQGIELSKVLLEMCMQVDKLPTQMAVDIIKEEVKSLF